MLLLQNSPLSAGLQEVPPSKSWLTFRQAIHALVKASATRSSVDQRYRALIRHMGNILSAAAGASLRELMDRMGHASTRAALIYLHDSDERQRKIASNLDALTRQELAEGSRGNASVAHRVARVWHGRRVRPGTRAGGCRVQAAGRWVLPG